MALIPNKTLTIIVIVSAVALSGGVMTFAIGIPNSPCAGATGTTRSFTLVADTNGFNGSREHSTAWPVMTVSRCDMVVVRIVNNDTQSHGFAVSYYAVRGTEVVGEQFATVQFLATKTGRFNVYCNLVTCSIHAFMENGLLTVT